VSAHARRVLSKGNEWDRLRLMPEDGELDGCSLAERIAHHWTTVNGYLLDFADGDPLTRVALFGDLDAAADGWCRHLGVTIRDREGLREHLATRPNRSDTAARPDGFEDARLDAICGEVWARARRASSLPWTR
jgi:hypothetical protein